MKSHTSADAAEPQVPPARKDGMPAAAPLWPRPAISPWWWLILFSAAALNLRAPVVVLGPLLAPLMESLSLSASQASLLSAGMVICFGLLSPFAPAVAARLGLDRAVAWAVTAIAAGGMLRAVPEFGLMLVGTLIAGTGIAFGNVFLPSLVKRDRPDRIGSTMGLYTVVMGIGATLAAGAAIPLMELSGSWSGPFLWIGAFGLLTSFAWWAVALRSGKVAAGASQPSFTALLRNRTAWILTTFMGIQSLGFYTIQAWVAAVAVDGGVSHRDAGWMLSLINFTSIPASYIVARWAAKSRNQGLFALGLTGMIMVAVVGLAVAPAEAPLAWAILLGIGQSGCFSLALTLIVLRSQTPADAAALSAMTHCIGYTFAAAGPLAFGALQSLSGSWTPSLMAMLGLLAIQAWIGLAIGRTRPVSLRQ